MLSLIDGRLQENPHPTNLISQATLEVVASSRRAAGAEGPVAWPFARFAAEARIRLRALYEPLARRADDCGRQPVDTLAKAGKTQDNKPCSL